LTPGSSNYTDVLTADGVGRILGSILSEDFEFLVTVGVGVVGDRWFHGASSG
jgi:hypothetical protein